MDVIMHHTYTSANCEDSFHQLDFLRVVVAVRNILLDCLSPGVAVFKRAQIIHIFEEM